MECQGNINYKQTRLMRYNSTFHNAAINQFVQLPNGLALETPQNNVSLWNLDESRDEEHSMWKQMNFAITNTY